MADLSPAEALGIYCEESMPRRTDLAEAKQSSSKVSGRKRKASSLLEAEEIASDADTENFEVIEQEALPASSGLTRVPESEESEEAGEGGPQSQKASSHEHDRSEGATNHSAGTTEGRHSKRARRSDDCERLSKVKRMVYECDAPRTKRRAEEFYPSPPLRSLPEANFQALLQIRFYGLPWIVYIAQSYEVSPETFAMAVNIYDRFLCCCAMNSEGSPDLAFAVKNRVQAPLACFLMACKYCEVSAPRIADLEYASRQRCTAKELRDTEMTILGMLNWDIHAVTATDILHTLLSFAPKQKVQVIHRASQFFLELAYSCPAAAKFKGSSMAVSALSCVCRKHNLTRDFLDFVPDVLFNEETEECSEVVFSFAVSRGHGV